MIVNIALPQRRGALEKSRNLTQFVAKFLFSGHLIGFSRQD